MRTHIYIKIDGQCIGRLVRLTQAKEVKWIILQVNDTTYDFMQWKACAKEVQALYTELHFPGWIDGHLVPMKLIAYVGPRVLWSHPFHCYVWEAVRVQQIQDFNSEETPTCGRFYHLLSRLLLTTETPPDEAAILLGRVSVYHDVLPFQWIESGGADKNEQLTWDGIRALLVNISKDMNWVAEKRKGQATTEFGSEKKRKAHHIAKEDEPAAEETPAKKRRKTTTKPKTSKKGNGEGAEGEEKDFSRLRCFLKLGSTCPSMIV